MTLSYNAMVRTEPEDIACLSLKRDPNFPSFGTPTSGETGT